MAAPTVTVRSTPAGKMMNDGFRTLIAFALDPDVSFWEKTVKTPGRDGGDAINTTTMHNVRYRSKAPRALVDVTDSGSKVAYDPAVKDQIDQLINQEGAITYKYPDGTTESIFGFLQKFIPDDNEEGKQPEAEITIICTNMDPVNDVEASPAIASVSGT